MSIWAFVLFAIYILFMVYLRQRIKKRRKAKKKWDPFRRWKMTTIIRKKDGSTFERPFKRFEYVGQETEEGEVIGIYHIYEMSPKQKKWEEYVKKFR